MKLISLGQLNKYIAFPIIGGISKCICESILYYAETQIGHHPFLVGINAGLAMCLAFIPFIFIKLRLKKSITYKKEKWNIRKIILIILCGFLEFLQKFLSYSFINDVDNNIWIFNIIYFSGFSYLILKIKLYNHQLFSSLVMIIIGIIYNIIIMKDMKATDIPYLLLSIFIETVYSLNIVLNKYVMEFYFCSPYELCFYEGIFILSLNIILATIFTHVEITKGSTTTKIIRTFEYNNITYIDNFYEFYHSIDSYEVIMFCISLTNRLIFNLFSLITNKYYTPCHIILLLIIGECQFAFETEEDSELILPSISYFIIFFMILIYLEIIELNFCGLQENLKRNIDERAKIKEKEEDGSSLNTDVKRGSADSNTSIELSFDFNADSYK